MRFASQKRASAITIVAFLILVTFQSSLLGASDNVNGPVPMELVFPYYHRLARSANIEGDVSIEIHIDDEGMPQLELLSGHPILAQAVVDAVQQWRFKCPTTKGKEQILQVLFMFRLMPSGTALVKLTPRFYPPSKIEVRAEREKPQVVP